MVTFFLLTAVLISVKSLAVEMGLLEKAQRSAMMVILSTVTNVRMLAYSIAVETEYCLLGLKNVMMEI